METSGKYIYILLFIGPTLGCFFETQKKEVVQKVPLTLKAELKRHDQNKSKYVLFLILANHSKQKVRFEFDKSPLICKYEYVREEGGDTVGGGRITAIYSHVKTPTVLPNGTVEEQRILSLPKKFYKLSLVVFYSFDNVIFMDKKCTGETNIIEFIIMGNGKISQRDIAPAGKLEIKGDASCPSLSAYVMTEDDTGAEQDMKDADAQRDYFWGGNGRAGGLKTKP